MIPDEIKVGKRYLNKKNIVRKVLALSRMSNYVLVGYEITYLPPGRVFPFRVGDCRSSSLSAFCKWAEYEISSGEKSNEYA